MNRVTLVLTVLLLAPLAALQSADAPKPVAPNEERQAQFQPAWDSLPPRSPGMTRGAFCLRDENDFLIT